jgi:hypothetical protein
MSFSDWFVDRHTKFLETELADIHARHTAEIQRYREENKSLRDDIDRLRLFLHPGLAAVTLPHEQEKETPFEKSAVPSGTPWQKVMAREIEADRIRWEAAEAQKKKDAQANSVPEEAAK